MRSRWKTVLEICRAEEPIGVIVSVGGQAANNLALPLLHAGINILGTSAQSIDQAEDRDKFSRLLDELEIDQPAWTRIDRAEEADEALERLGGLPVLVRPSYVLSGAAMTVCTERSHLRNLLAKAVEVSPGHPVVLTRFETNSKEIEIDAVADGGKLVLWAISEHVENAGVHSGDATLVLPPQKLYLETIRRAKRIATDLARALNISGPFNLQLLARHNAIKVIELNLRASRSFPFVSKVTGKNYIREATRRILGAGGENPVHDPLDLDYVGVKAAQFSFARIKGADPTLGVEMASTGEVGCFGRNFSEALLLAMLATGFAFPKRGVLLSLGPLADKYRFVEHANILAGLGLTLYATPGTAELLSKQGLAVTAVGKVDTPLTPMAQDVLDRGEVDLVINIPIAYDADGRPDGYIIRRRAADLGIPLITNLQLAMSVVEALGQYTAQTLPVQPWSEYVTGV